MRWFLDMCIILYYLGEGDKPELNKKVENFVKNKQKEVFLLCYYIKEHDLPRWIKRQKIIYEEIIKKISDDKYILGSSKDASYLTERDKKKMQKILASLEEKENKEEVILFLKYLQLKVETRIKNFLEDFIDEFVIPIEEIDEELKSCFRSFLNVDGKINESDVNILSSAIQEHNKNPIVIITADKKDINKEIFNWVFQSNLSLSKKYKSLPEIAYLQNL